MTQQQIIQEMENFKAEMRRLKNLDAHSDNMTYNMGWDCATDYAVEHIRKIYLSLLKSLREGIKDKLIDREFWMNQVNREGMKLKEGINQANSAHRNRIDELIAIINNKKLK